MLTTRALYVLIKNAIPDSIDEYSEKYETRLKVQKFIYLFTQLWGDKSYGYSWYLAGPYSSILTNQVYSDLIPTLSEKQEEWDARVLSENARAILQTIQKLVDKTEALAGKMVPDSRVYELIASIWYIANTETEPTKIKKTLLLNKPFFEEVRKLDDIVKIVLATKSEMN